MQHTSKIHWIPYKSKVSLYLTAVTSLSCFFSILYSSEITINSPHLMLPRIVHCSLKQHNNRYKGMLLRWQVYTITVSSKKYQSRMYQVVLQASQIFNSLRLVYPQAFGRQTPPEPIPRPRQLVLPPGIPNRPSGIVKPFLQC